MKKIIALTLSLILLSCTTNEDQNNTNSGVVLLREMITNSQGSQTTHYFNYTGNKIVNVTSNGYEWKYYYTGDLITKTENYDNNVLSLTTLFNYNSQNNLISFIDLFNNNNQGNRTTLTYNSNGTITYNNYTGDITTQTSLVGSYTATLSNNEIIILKDESSNITHTFDYDSKNYFMKNVLGFEKIRMALSDERNVSGIFQNMTQRRETLPNQSPRIKEINQFSYNSDDFPVTINTSIYSSIGTLYYYYTVSLFYE
jgi:hypothetical protein